MKKNQLFLLLIGAFITLSTCTQQPNAQSSQKIESASLLATCKIKIMQEKLKHANNAIPIESRVQEVGLVLKGLYDQCQSIINDPYGPVEQSALSQQDWINKSLREIYLLQKDDATRNCFNGAILQLKKLSRVVTQDEKDAIIKDFIQNTQDCSYQHALILARPHLDAQIERWQRNKGDQQCDIDLFKLLLKHGLCRLNNFEEDLHNVYDSCKAKSVMSVDFDEFTDNMEFKINKIQNNRDARNCLQDLVDFQDCYFKAQTDVEREDLKSSFCVRYLQCKNK